MVGRSLTALWSVALALMASKGLADLARDGQSALALAAVVLPISIGILVRARGSARRFAPVVSAQAESAAVFRQLSEPDQVRIAGLAASGNAIGAIKALRELAEIDLRTAKNVVDQIAATPDDHAV